MRALEASPGAGDALHLTFVTDEIPIRPVNEDGTGKVLCDILALRQFNDGRLVPVVMELKSAREMTRLVGQVSSYAELLDVSPLIPTRQKHRLLEPASVN